MRTKRHNAPVKKPKPRAKPKVAKKRVAVEQPAPAPVKEDAAPAVWALTPEPHVAWREEESKEPSAPVEKPWWLRSWR